MAYDIRILRLHRAHPFLLLFAPSGDAWRECDCYPQVPFPSVIPPAVIHIRPLLLPLHLETSLNELVNGC